MTSDKSAMTTPQPVRKAQPNPWPVALGFIGVAALVLGVALFATAHGSGAALMQFIGSALASLGGFALVVLLGVQALLWRPRE